LKYLGDGKSHRVRDDLGFSQLKRACIDSRCMSCASNIEIGIKTSTTDAALNRLSEPWSRRLKVFYFHLINASFISNALDNIYQSFGGV
jgi:hypothetical protein